MWDNNSTSNIPTRLGHNNPKKVIPLGVKSEPVGRDFWTVLFFFVKFIYLVSVYPSVYSRNRVVGCRLFLPEFIEANTLTQPYNLISCEIVLIYHFLSRLSDARQRGNLLRGTRYVQGRI